MRTRLHHTATRRPPVLRRGLGVLACAALASVLVIGVSAPSQAATKKAKPKATSVTLTAITHVPTAADPGSALVTSDPVDLVGHTSANLRGRRLSVQVANGSRFVGSTYSGTVSAKGTFSIRVTPFDAIGSVAYRVVFAGTPTLKASKGTKAGVFSSWFSLVDRPGVNPRGTAPLLTAPHSSTQLTVGGTTYATLLASTLTPGQSGAVDFALGAHCTAFRSTVGIAADGPHADLQSADFEVDANGAKKTVQSAAYDGVRAFTVPITGAKTLTLQVRDTSPAVPAANDGAVTDHSELAAWPDAEVLCSAIP